MADAERYAARTLDLLLPSERDTLEGFAVLLGLGEEDALSGWWRIVPLRDAFQAVALCRLVNRLQGGGESYASACREAGAFLGLGGGRSIRRRLRTLDDQGSNPERPWRRRGPAD